MTQKTSWIFYLSTVVCNISRNISTIYCSSKPKMYVASLTFFWLWSYLKKNHILECKSFQSWNEMPGCHSSSVGTRAHVCVYCHMLVRMAYCVGVFATFCWRILACIYSIRVCTAYKCFCVCRCVCPINYFTFMVLKQMLKFNLVSLGCMEHFPTLLSSCHAFVFYCMAINHCSN